MTTAMLPDLDEQTMQDLQPPCERRLVRNDPKLCSKPAEWVVRFSCCGTAALRCDPCVQEVLNQNTAHWCAACERLTYDQPYSSMERL